MSLKNLIESDFPEPGWWVKNILPKRGTTIIGGDSGNKKTFLALEIAIKCSTGMRFLDIFECKKAKVLYIDEENDKSLIKSRMIKLLKGNKISEIPGLLAFAFGNQLKLNKKGKDELDKLLTTYKPNIVILDSMVRFIEGDEDKSSDVKKNTSILKFLTDKHNCSFLALHHTTKRKAGSKHSLRGSGEFSAFVDLLIMVSGTVNLKLKQEKNRYCGATEIGGFDVIDCENGGLKVISVEIDKNTKTKFEQLKEIIPLWILQKKGSEKVLFDEILRSMESKGFKKSLISKALKTISEEGILAKCGHGMYEIPKSN
ncbi:AAA family ATPase [archaeon]|nr:AAA family ATPase [archaeon]